MPKAQGQVQNLGPIGERVAENVRALRGSMTYRELSDRLEELGRPIPVLGLSRIESKARRVDTDDLVALAIALEVSPVRLLLPPKPTADEHELVPLTPGKSAEWHLVWRWTAGEQPLLTHEEAANMDLTDKRVREFSEENQPYLKEPIAEADRQFRVRGRTPTPYRYTIWNDGQNISANSTWGSKALRELAEYEASLAEQEEERARVLGERADDGDR